MWLKIFSLSLSIKNLDKPLTQKILSNPDHEFVKTIVYIYTMESFIYSEMNKASRAKDMTKIKFYGPYASALGYIVHCGNIRGKKQQIKTDMKFYRGL